MDDLTLRMEIIQPLQYKINVCFKKLRRNTIPNETVLELAQRFSHSLENQTQVSSFSRPDSYKMIKRSRPNKCEARKRRIFCEAFVIFKFVQNRVAIVRVRRSHFESHMLERLPSESSGIST
jgi:hypothetical protein